MIFLDKVSKSFGDKTIFDGLNLTIYDGERIGIVGDNGQGKTTLLKLITGGLQPDSGTIKNDGSVAYLPQSTEFDVNTILSKFDDADFVNNFFIYLKKFRLQELEITKENFENFSCGEKTKIFLAYVLAQKPSVLILDEPTNHVDYVAKEEIVESVNSFSGTVIVVSHDVDFLNQTISKIFEVEGGKVSEFAGNFDDFKEQKEQIKLAKKREYEKQTKKIERLKNDISRYQNWTAKADAAVSKQGGSASDRRAMSTKTEADRSAGKMSQVVKSKISALEQELENRVESEKDFHINYKIFNENTKVKNLVQFEDVGIKFGEKQVFHDVNFTIKNGEKIALIGENGCGKTTLINMIVGVLEPTQGVVRKNPSLKLALMSQDVYDLPQEKTIFELAKEDASTMTLFLSNLVNMKIDKSRFNTKIGSLSSGEQMKIKLSQLILSDVNMIILDEPTNHLDISNKEFLKKVLAGYGGTLLIVSHDKNFLDGLLDRRLIFRNGTITEGF